MCANNKKVVLLLLFCLIFSISTNFGTYSSATSSFIIVPENYNKSKEQIVETKEKDPNATMSEIIGPKEETTRVIETTAETVSEETTKEETEESSKKTSVLIAPKEETTRIIETTAETESAETTKEETEESTTKTSILFAPKETTIRQTTKANETETSKIENEENTSETHTKTGILFAPKETTEKNIYKAKQETTVIIEEETTTIFNPRNNPNVMFAPKEDTSARSSTNSNKKENKIIETETTAETTKPRSNPFVLFAPKETMPKTTSNNDTKELAESEKIKETTIQSKRSFIFFAPKETTAKQTIKAKETETKNKIEKEETTEEANSLKSGLLFAPKKKHNISVTGDSYAGFLVAYETKTGDHLHEYAIPAKTIKDNLHIMLQACESNDDYLIIAIGVNEYYAETDLNDFAACLTTILSKAKENNKSVFTFSYMDFPKSNVRTFKHMISEYDNVIRGLSKYYENTHYIDMKDCSSKRYVQDDQIHFNEDFYDILYKRIQPYLN